MRLKNDDELPLVSILINNYNYGQFLPDAIDSALNQTYPNIEVIVVDDGSTDNSQAVIAGYGNAITAILKPNGGQASAFNSGFAASRGEIICFLDADDVFLPHKVQTIVDALLPYQEGIWCFHPLQLVNSSEQLSKALQQGKGAIASQACDLRDNLHQGGKGLRQQLPFSLPATSGLCFNHALLQQILPMPEAEGIAIGDSYVQFVALALGKGVALSNSLACQRVHSHNLYTRSDTRKAATARIFCLTAFWIRINFPCLTNFTHKLFAAGLSDAWRVSKKEPRTQEVIEKYFCSLPLLERWKIRARSLYYYCTSNHVE